MAEMLSQAALALALIVLLGLPVRAVLSMQGLVMLFEPQVAGLLVVALADTAGVSTSLRKHLAVVWLISAGTTLDVLELMPAGAAVLVLVLIWANAAVAVLVIVLVVEFAGIAVTVHVQQGSSCMQQRWWCSQQEQWH